MSRKIKLGIAGFGNMGCALAKALVKSRSFEVQVYDKSRAKTKGLKKPFLAQSLKQLIKTSRILILAIKPQDVGEFLRDLRQELIQKDLLLISIAAGIPLNLLEKQLKGVKIIRVMPNLAAKVKASMSFMAKGKYAKRGDLKTAQKIFSAIGEVMIIKESYLDKVTSISGSGPGYVFYFMFCLYRAAVGLGFDRRQAKKMVISTFQGAVKLAQSSNQDFKFLFSQVVSKGGTTEAALKIFQSRHLDKIIIAGANQAYRKAQNLSKKFSQNKRG